MQTLIEIDHQMNVVANGFPYGIQRRKIIGNTFALHNLLLSHHNYAFKCEKSV